MTPEESHFETLISHLHNQVDLFAKAYKRESGKAPARLPMAIRFPALRAVFQEFLAHGRLVEPRQ